MPDLVGPKIAYYGFTGVIEPQNATKIASAFNAAVNAQFDEIHLCFSSIGGTISDGMFLYNYIKALPLKTVFFAIGNIASIALPIFLAADERYASKHAIFMTHQAYSPPNQNIDAARAEALLHASLAEDARIESILRERSAFPEDVLKNRRLVEVYFLPAEARKYQVIHDVVEFSLPRGVQIFQI